MTIDIEAALVRAIAPPGLADAIIGDLYERRSLAAHRNDVLRSLVSLLAYNASRALADNWAFALASAALTWAWCVATIPLWGHIGMGGEGYHLLRLAIIGLVLGRIPRASTLSCTFLLLLIGVSDWAIHARDTIFLLTQDGIAMGSMLMVLRLLRVIRPA